MEQATSWQEVNIGLLRKNRVRGSPAARESRGRGTGGRKKKKHWIWRRFVFCFLFCFVFVFLSWYEREDSWWEVCWGGRSAGCFLCLSSRVLPQHLAPESSLVNQMMEILLKITNTPPPSTWPLNMAWALDFKYECPDSCCVVSCPVPPVPVLRIEPSTLHTLGRSSIRSHTCQPCIAFF